MRLLLARQARWVHSARLAARAVGRHCGCAAETRDVRRLGAKLVYAGPRFPEGILREDLHLTVTTDRLVLDRAFGDLQTEDYIKWAVGQLRSGADSPSLRILAGLSAKFDREEVESYFEKTCSELGIPWMPMDRTPREAAQVVRALYAKGALSPEDVVRRMSALASEDFEDELLMRWRYLASDLDTMDLRHRGWAFEGRFYPIESIENLRQTVDQEWEIFESVIDESDLSP